MGLFATVPLRAHIRAFLMHEMSKGLFRLRMLTITVISNPCIVYYKCVC